MPVRVLIPATNDAVAASASDTVKVSQNRVTISANGLAGAEQAAIEYSADNSDWAPAQNSDGDIILTAAKQQAVMRGSGYYRASKQATVASVAVKAAS